MLKGTSEKVFEVCGAKENSLENTPEVLKEMAEGVSIPRVGEADLVEQMVEYGGFIARAASGTSHEEGRRIYQLQAQQAVLFVQAAQYLLRIPDDKRHSIRLANRDRRTMVVLRMHPIPSGRFTRR
ncbi:hypothetical protein BHE74_00046907, partial [Ensete ventricosum]